MSQLRSANSLELEIQTLLKHHVELDLTADALIKKYENEKLSLSEFETIATFLLHSGFCATLTDLIVRKLGDQSKTPWGHFAEALFLSSALIEPEVKKAILEGAEEDHALALLSRSRHLDHFEEEIPRQRGLRQQNFKEKSKLQRQDLLQELDVMRSQGLHAEEDKLIEKMNRLFPNDSEILKLRTALKERLALDFIAKRPRPKHQVFIPQHEPKDAATQEALDQIEKEMTAILEREPELKSWLANDFALAMIVWENFESALRLLAMNTETHYETDWLRAEALLGGRRHAELLNHLTFLETAYSQDPDNIYAVHYLRAQALWGLNQKMMAIEILEGMIVSRPQYRSASALLDQWKDDFL